MQGIVCIRIAFVWIAFVLKDNYETGEPRLGLSKRQAVRRASDNARLY